MKPFDKYWHYHASVQSPDVDVRFLRNLYRSLRGKPARMLHEDFCGTFANLCEWVKLDKRHQGVGIDLDPEPLNYGKKHYLSKLSEEQQSRLTLLQANVLKSNPPKADIVAAMNFSYFIFQTRDELRTYFKKVHSNLKPKGVFVADVFGGPACQAPITDKTPKRGFTYYWDQLSFEPITQRAKFAIHFKRKGEKIRRNVFTYDWRVWTVPELREVMIEAGFKKTLVYWEDDKGAFRPGTKGDSNCEAWIAYVIGLKG